MTINKMKQKKNQNFGVQSIRTDRTHEVFFLEFKIYVGISLILMVKRSNLRVKITNLTS